MMQEEYEARLRSMTIGIMLEKISVGWMQWVWEKVKHQQGWRKEVFSMLNDFRFDFRDRSWELPDEEFWHQYKQE